MRELPHTHGCFVCGESNRSGLKLRFETDGRVVRARFKLGPEYAGFREVVHGGIIATVLDEVMVWACAVATRRFAYCAEFTVRFSQPLRPGEEVTATASLVNNRRDRLFEAQGELRGNSGCLHASSSGKYMPIGNDIAKVMLADLIGGAAEFAPPGCENKKP